MSAPAFPAEPRPPRLVLLDREGVLLQHVEPYLIRRAQACLIDGAIAAVADITQAGAKVAVVSNQSCINRGLVSARFVAEVCDWLSQTVRTAGGELMGCYICPHRPDEGCACRKPAPGLLQQAMHDAGVLPQDTWMIGDHDTDVLAGYRAGCAYRLHVRSGRQSEPSRFADACFADLRAAITALLPSAP